VGPVTLYIYGHKIKCTNTPSCDRLGSVAGPLIQATGRSKFEDGLGSGDFVSGYSYHISVRTRFSVDYR
jgi:hypothetical protein